MDEEDIDVIPVPALSVCNATGATAYLVFLASAVKANQRFWSWFYEVMLLDFVNHVGSQYPQYKDHTAWVPCNGEDAQIRMIYENENLNQALQDAKVVIAKSPPSTTEITP